MQFAFSVPVIVFALFCRRCARVFFCRQLAMVLRPLNNYAIFVYVAAFAANLVAVQYFIGGKASAVSVSYKHLTLPTTPYV